MRFFLILFAMCCAIGAKAADAHGYFQQIAASGEMPKWASYACFPDDSGNEFYFVGNVALKGSEVLLIQPVSDGVPKHIWILRPQWDGVVRGELRDNSVEFSMSKGTGRFSIALIPRKKGPKSGKLSTDTGICESSTGISTTTAATVPKPPAQASTGAPGRTK